MLERLGLTADQVEVMTFVRDAMNGALANAKMVQDHVVNGPYHFDYIDSDQQIAYAFTVGDHSFIGLTTGMAQWVFGAGDRLRSSLPVWEFVGLDLIPARLTRITFNFCSSIWRWPSLWRMNTVTTFLVISQTRSLRGTHGRHHFAAIFNRTLVKLQQTVTLPCTNTTSWCIRTSAHRWLRC